MPLVRSAEEEVEEAAFLALYGAWRPLTPPEVAAELRAFDRPWWLVGGWAIEAATGFRREHEDTDVSILACDVPRFVEAVGGRWHVWNNAGGVLRPLRPGTPVEVDPRSQLWLRAGAAEPWVLDVSLTPDDAGRWTDKFVPDPARAVADVTWVHEDGLRYLAPERVLAYKARLGRSKDEPDFEAALPLLDDTQRRWLCGALEHLVPAHPWIARLSDHRRDDPREGV